VSAAERPPGERPERRFNLFVRVWVGRGYTRLAACYPAVAEPRGTVFTRQSIELSDRVRHKRTARLVAAPEGLYVRVSGLVMMTLPALLIPWSEVAVGEKTRLFGRQARRLTFGRPPVGSLVVWLPVLSACQSYRHPAQEEDEDD
jgi:hypothetical protein